MSMIEEALHEIEEEQLEEGKIDTIKSIISKVKATGEKVGLDIIGDKIPNINSDAIKDSSKADLGHGVDFIYLDLGEEGIYVGIKIDKQFKYLKKVNINKDDFETISKASEVKTYEDKFGNTTKTRRVGFINKKLMIIDDEVIGVEDVKEVYIGNENNLFKTKNGYIYSYGDATVPVNKKSDKKLIFKSENSLVSIEALNIKKEIKLKGIKVYSVFLKNTKE